MSTGYDGETIAILDFGSQYSQLIARRVRECRVYSTLVRYDTPIDELRRMPLIGLILSGGPSSVYSENAPLPDPGIFELGVPVLGICYGLQLMAHLLGGAVEPRREREYGKAELEILRDSPLLEGIRSGNVVWMSHGDAVTRLPRGFRSVARTRNSPRAVIEHRSRPIYGLQFHPEVVHTSRGRKILGNFVHRICGASSSWTMGSFVKRSVEQIRETVGNDRVLLALSGGVDSSVAAALIHRAVGKRLTSVFVDNGLLRMGETERVRSVFRDAFGMNLRVCNATNRFLGKLKGVVEPEKKRKIIGTEFIRVFEDEAAKLKPTRYLAQGTTYPDVIESVSIGGNPAAMIKSHHNVGGLPRRMKFELLEPLRALFKDEVRQVGRQLGLPDEIVRRQPFPGPGLAVRILGEVTRRRLRILREADWIVVGEMKDAGLYYRIWQTFAVLLPIRTVGVMGDERTYEHVVAIRAVHSQDGMTADWVRLPHPLMERLSNRIINEVKGVNRVVYDISSKPPSTIEWE